MNKLNPFRSTVLLGSNEYEVQVEASYHIGQINQPDDPDEIDLTLVSIDQPGSLRNKENIVSQLDEDTLEELKHEAHEQIDIQRPNDFDDVGD
jgi:hypothetical protein